MHKFGVIEIASAKTTTAPGWAYVPDSAATSTAAATLPSNRKRARNAAPAVLALGDLTARQEARLRKEVEALDRDGSRDNSIPLPVKQGRAQAKHTPNVRKILQSQKTFANHLDDFLAMQALEVNSATQRSTPRSTGPTASSNRRTLSSKKDGTSRTATKDQEPSKLDGDLPPILPPPIPSPSVMRTGDENPLLVSRVPERPSDDELRRLLAHPPLTYLEALGKFDDTYPARVFCQVCGYWGRVRCMKCGTRLCALDCLEMHREECITRYGL